MYIYALTASLIAWVRSKNMPIRINNKTIRLGDIADVTMTYKDPSSPQFYYEGKPAIGIAISMDARRQ